VAVSAILVGGGAFALLASPASASPSAPAAQTTDPAPDAAPVVAAKATTTLPLFGVPLTVDVSTTPSGALADVAVNPADGLTATKVHPNHVTFVNDEATGKVRVETRHGAERTGVTAGAVGDIAGAGSWTGDVFGTGATTTVTFDIVANPDGSPDIANIVSGDPSAVVGEVQHNASEHGQVARATVTFSADVQTRRLNIIAAVFTKGDTTRATSQVSLSKVSGASLPADQVAGEHTWSGMLCDGTAATVNYTVAADGGITAGAVTPATGTADVKGNTLRVKFSDTESVRIRVGGKDGDLRISADPRLRCGRTTPGVNTPTSPDATDPGHHRDGRDGRDGNGPGKGNDPGQSHRGDDGQGRDSHKGD
jgi:hypothetical protein